MAFHIKITGIIFLKLYPIKFNTIIKYKNKSKGTPIKHLFDKTEFNFSEPLIIQDEMPSLIALIKSVL